MRSTSPPLFDAPADDVQTPATALTDELRQRIKSAIADFLRGRRESRLEVYERRAGRLVRR